MATVFANLIAREAFSLRANVRVMTTVDLDSVGNGTWVTTTSTLTAGVAGLTTIDGVVLADGDRVLVKNQGAGVENGIYEASDTLVGSPTVLTRASDLPLGGAATGSFIHAMEGTANLQTGWICTNIRGTDIVETDALTFRQFDVIGTLSVPRGGTGATSFTNNGVVIGQGTSALTTISAANNAVLVTNGSGVPSWSTTLPSGLTASFVDANFTIRDDVDATKLLQFQAATGTTGTTVTLSIPPASDTITGIAATQTLTNKTITSGRYNELLDTAGNREIVFTATGSAVNYLTIANAATTARPTITATGSDTNIGMAFQAKGTGVYAFLGTSTLPSTIRLFEDTDNGTNSIGIDVPATISSDLTFTLPGTDGSSGDYLTTDGSGNLAFVTPTTGRVAYHIAPNQIAVTSNTYTTVGIFAWDHSRYSSYTSGALVWEASITGNRNIDIRLRNITANNNVVEVTGVSTSAFRTDTGFTNPTADARVELQVRKSASGGNSPAVYGVQLEWVPS